MTRRPGFTLVELLIVILIIALLLTLLIPGISAALRAANRAICQSNLKNIGHAFHTYYSDYQVYPERTTAPNPYSWDDDWYKQLFKKYIPNPKALYCPSNNHEMAPPGDKWDAGWTGAKREISYVILDGNPSPGGGPLDHYNKPIGALDAENSWNLSDYKENLQGFRCVQNVFTWNATDNKYDTTVEYPITRPQWTDGKSVPVMGDLILEKTGAAWNTNHSTVDSEDPLGMNILYGDGHAAWVAPKSPSTSATTRKTQRLWRRIWKGPGGTYVRWLVDPSEVSLPDKYPERS
jgi:prepilin-type N-terminal cleavage/methylation domain-containing protein/prepilin-type processing-associated H-X9-DG protein